MSMIERLPTPIKVLAGIALWGSLGIWILDDGPEKLFGKPQPQGIFVVTATENIKQDEQLFFSTGLQTKIDSSREAFTACKTHIEVTPELSCRKVVFFEQNSCMVRYRKGEHTDAAVAGTLAEADAAALRLCKERRDELDYRCIKDVEVCTDGSVNRSRPWGRAGLAIAKVTPKDGGPHRVSVVQSEKPSKASASLDMDEICRKSTGNNCYDRRTFGGDICYALAANAIGNFVFYSSFYDTAGEAGARGECNSLSNEECIAKWLCASPRYWE